MKIHIRKRFRETKEGSSPPMGAEASPQLLGDMRERLNTTDECSTTQTGIELLEDMQDRLSLEGRELQRMEDEGGLPLSTTHKAKANASLKASQLIKTLLRSCLKKRGS